MSKNILTPYQLKILGDVVKTNGGGVDSAKIRVSAIKRLHEELGFVQGKSGNQSRVVHTHQGLQYYRKVIDLAKGTEGGSDGKRNS